MAVPRLDPRVYQDRIIPYREYRQLSEQYRSRRSKSWFRFIPMLGTTTQKRPVVRLLPYKVALGAGLMVLTLSVALMAYFDADTARLAYAEQDYSRSLAGLAQSELEAIGGKQAQQSEVFAGDVVTPSAVVYPEQTHFLVLTNIPEAEGRTLVEELYPLSRQVIKVEP